VKASLKDESESEVGYFFNKRENYSEAELVGDYLRE
jgi:hypothetical protein